MGLAVTDVYKRQDVDLAVGVIPDLGAGRGLVNGRFGGVHKLAGDDAVGRLLLQLLGLGDGTLHALSLIHISRAHAMLSMGYSMNGGYVSANARESRQQGGCTTMHGTSVRTVLIEIYYAGLKVVIFQLAISQTELRTLIGDVYKRQNMGCWTEERSWRPK